MSMITFGVCGTFSHGKQCACTAANLLAIVYWSVLLIRIGKQNVKIIVK